MARKKKKYTPPAPQILRTPSNSYMDHVEHVVRKIMKLVDFDAGFLDSLTKRQKHLLLLQGKAIISIRIAPGHSVPKAYLNYVSRNFIQTMEGGYVNDNAEVGLTFYDLINHGIAFLRSILTHLSWNILSEEQKKELQSLYDKCLDHELLLGITIHIDACLLGLMSTLSQMQYRVYGYNFKWDARSNGSMSAFIEIHSHAPDSTHLLIHGNVRKVYKVFLGGVNGQKPITAFIEYNKLFPHREYTDNRRLTIYIQSHAIHRMKERLDTMDPIDRTRMMVCSLIFSPEIRLGADSQPLLCCRWEDTILGYFAFVVQDDKLVIITFLPLAFPSTSEGKQLHERLHLQPEDIRYLEMDKLRFYIYTNFDKIPKLKQVLIDIGIYNIVSTFTPNPDITPQMIETRTQRVKKFLGY
jgi:hypothetical protein